MYFEYNKFYMIFVNFKTYPQGTGEEALKLAKICEEVSLKSKIEIIPVVQFVDLFRITQEVKIPVWIQHLDFFSQGQHTGWESLESVIEAGGKGTLLNHAEHQIPPGTVNQVIKRITKLPNDQIANFKIMVCCHTLGQAEKLAKLKPDFLAYEPPELIGGDLAVSEAKPFVIERIVKKLPDMKIMVGAGIKTGKDVKRSLELGTKGILVSSAVVLAKDQKAVLEDLASGYK
jgi:triosephosphate isomerase (TIM)